MKHFLLILSLFLVNTTGIFAQQEEDVEDNETIRDKMSEYIQKKLNLTDEEAKKFKPIFISYFKDWKKAVRDAKGDNLLLRKRIADLQLQYRDKLKDIIGEQRSNRVFNYQKDFIQELRRLRQERVRNRRQ